MARRRLTPAQPGYLGSSERAPETKSALLPGGGTSSAAAPIAKVSGQSAEAAALRELAEGIEAARREGRMVVDIPLGDIAPSHLLRDRIRLDREELDALKDSIRARGQQVPAEISPLGDDDDSALPYRFGLISGWRRLRALSELYDETDDPRFSTLRALIRPSGDAAESYVAMVEENELRAGLSYYERARLVAEATKQGVFADQSAALRILFANASRAKRSKIASFIDIHEGLGDLLNFPAEIPERLGLALVSRLRHGDRQRIRAALQKVTVGEAAAELALLERLVRPSGTVVSRAKQPAETLRPGLAMQVTRKDRKLTVTLEGAAVDDALAEALRRLLRQLG
jgi:ParB-like chromosome segregation protein Spo0J